MARPKPALTLTDDERSQLTTWASRPKSPLRLATRARIVLACADEPNNLLVAGRLRGHCWHLAESLRHQATRWPRR